MTSFFKKRYEEIAEEHREENLVYRFVRQFNHIEASRTKEYGKLFVGIALLLFSADMIVKLSSMIAHAANIPVFFIGLVIISLGATLPELIFSIQSVNEHEPSMFFGNILGSIIANSTLIIGFTAIINPIKVVAIDNYIIASITFVVVFVIFAFFVNSKKRLDRWEGLVLLLIYILFILLQLL